ncbi:unnamed protein product [Brachionus calyciflorus]|uniref:G-protein coupled receptors family 1 profile domain-containing protein n=1 Tax=Brachionus calyciflorus TaxID=104777 RepID=A0A813MKP7_9BILA|nr:unnamed protein product [Brachionus calyciflorus]
MLDFSSISNLNKTNISNNNTMLNTGMINSIAEFLNTYYMMFIIVIGLIGNSITIVIFWRTTLTHTKKTSFYLISLALSDIGFLLILLFKYLDDHEILLTFSKLSIACKLSVFLGYIFNFLSCSLIFTFTLQRLFVICFPLRINFLNLERGSKFLVIFLILFACLCYGINLKLYDLKLDRSQNRTICTTKEGADTQADQFSFLDSLITLIIPFFGLLIMNAIIIRTLKKSSYNFSIRTSSNHFTYEPNNSAHRNSENFHKIQEGVSMGASFNENRNKSILKKGIYFKKTFKKESANSDHDSKNTDLSVNGSAILSKQTSDKTLKCFECKIFRNKFKSNDAIFSTNLLNSNNHSTSYISKRRSILINPSMRPSERKLSTVRIEENNPPGSKKNSVELSSLLGKKNDARGRTSFKIGGSKPNSVSRKVTKMLIVVSTTFLLLNLPVHTINVYIAIRIFLTAYKEVHPTEYYLREIFHSLFYTSFSCNFLLYSISGATFRTEFKMLILSLIGMKSKTKRKALSPCH